MTGTFAELLQWMLSEFGLDYRGLDKIGMQQALVEYLRREEARGKRMVLVIDEAQALSPEVLEELRLFSNVNAGRAMLLQTILVGQLALRDTSAPSGDAAARAARRRRLPAHAARQGADPGLHPPPAGHRRPRPGGSLHPRSLRCHLRRERRRSRASSICSATPRSCMAMRTRSQTIDADTVKEMLQDKAREGGWLFSRPARRRARRVTSTGN